MGRCSCRQWGSVIVAEQAELDPNDDLAPNTSYTVEVVSKYPDHHALSEQASFRFTTGTARLPERSLEPPKGRAATVDGVPPSGSSCSGGTIYTCLSFEDARDVEILARRGDQIVMRWVLPVDADEVNVWNGAFAFDELPDCIELRRRDATGRRSAPLSFCGDALGVRPFRASDMGKYWFECSDSSFGPSRVSEPPNGKPTTTPVDAGLPADSGEMDDAPPPPHERGPAGGAAPAPSEAPQHRAYGCSAVPATRPNTFGLGIALALVVFAAHRVRRRRSPAS